MKVVVISGGSSGIGEACVQKFVQNNYHVYNLDIKSNLALNQYHNYTFIQTDVAVETNIITALTTVKQLHQYIDVVVVSAGKHLSATITNTTTEQLMEVVNLNLLGAYWLLQHALPLIREGGSIITIGSDQYQVAKPNSTVYGMTKAALAYLTKSIALDYAKFKIRANCIGTGTIDTPLYRTAINNYSHKSGITLAAIEQDENQQQPIGRIGMPEEVAELAFFLAGEKSSFMTGAYIPCDGGYTTR